MSSMFRSLFAFAIFLTLAVGPAQAGLLILNYTGATVSGSALPDGSPIPLGTAFEIHAFFPDTPTLTPGTGFGVYPLTSLNVTVGSTPYFVPSINIGNYHVELSDPLNNTALAGKYLPFLIGASDAFYPVYSTATPALDARHAAPTVFSGYQGSPLSSLTFLTASGNLVLAYDDAVGLDSSITVPEPSSLALLFGGTFGTFLARRRRTATPA